jgi:hypothetical protein
VSFLGHFGRVEVKRIQPDERLGAGHGERPSMASRYVQSTGRGAAFEVGKQRFGRQIRRFHGLSPPKVVREGAIAAH